MSKNTSRAQALNWWRGLSLHQQYSFFCRYNPQVPFSVLQNSSSQIERLWTQVQKEQKSNQQFYIRSIRKVAQTFQNPNRKINDMELVLYEQQGLLFVTIKDVVAYYHHAYTITKDLGSWKVGLTKTQEPYFLVKQMETQSGIYVPRDSDIFRSYLSGDVALRQLTFELIFDMVIVQSPTLDIDEIIAKTHLQPLQR